MAYRRWSGSEKPNRFSCRLYDSSVEIRENYQKKGITNNKIIDPLFP